MTLGGSPCATAVSSAQRWACSRSSSLSPGTPVRRRPRQPSLARPPVPNRLRPHPFRSQRDHRLLRRSLKRDSLRLEALRDFVAVKARNALVADVLAHVLGEVPGRDPRLLERPRADRQITDQLAVDDPAPPHVLDQPCRTNRPTAKCTCRPCPPGCHSATHTYANGLPSSRRNPRKNPQRPSAAPPGRNTPHPRRSASRTDSAGSQRSNGEASPWPVAPPQPASDPDPTSHPRQTCGRSVGTKQPPPSAASGYRLNDQSAHRTRLAVTRHSLEVEPDECRLSWLARNPTAHGRSAHGASHLTRLT